MAENLRLVGGWTDGWMDPDRVVFVVTYIFVFYEVMTDDDDS
jgi:hypothetical protein